MIIDFHTHIFPPFFSEQRERFFSTEPGFELLYSSPDSKLIDAEELLREMDGSGIQRSVVFGFPWEKTDHFRRHNDYIMESVLKYPDRLTGLCCFSPLSSRAGAEAGRCLDQGLCGIGELALYHPASKDRCFRRLGELADLCAEKSVVMLLHMNEPVGKSYPGKIPAALEDFYKLVKEHASTRFVLAHWGGGLFFYSMMKKEVREALLNTWFDTAASPFLYAPDIYRIAGEIIGFEKILFGSDFPLIAPTRYFSEIEASGIPNEAIQMIGGENAARLLRLS